MLWSMWLIICAMAEILLPFCVEVKIEIKALRAKSPEPPMPFTICRPMMWTSLLYHSMYQEPPAGSTTCARWHSFARMCCVLRALRRLASVGRVGASTARW